MYLNESLNRFVCIVLYWYLVLQMYSVFCILYCVFCVCNNAGKAGPGARARHARAPSSMQLRARAAGGARATSVRSVDALVAWVKVPRCWLGLLALERNGHSTTAYPLDAGNVRHCAGRRVVQANRWHTPIHAVRSPARP